LVADVEVVLRNLLELIEALQEAAAGQCSIRPVDPTDDTQSVVRVPTANRYKLFCEQGLSINAPLLSMATHGEREVLRAQKDLQRVHDNLVKTVERYQTGGYTRLTADQKEQRERFVRETGLGPQEAYRRARQFGIAGDRTKFFKLYRVVHALAVPADVNAESA
jgi:hypothetical protein